MIVVRYFGGTKLGVGGLIRAYGEAAAQALDRARRRTGIPSIRIVLRYPYAHTAAVMRALDSAQAGDIEHGYSDGGSGGEVTAVVPREEVAVLRDRLREQTAGEVEPDPREDCLLYRPVATPPASSA